jgi:hypothetical protein
MRKAWILAVAVGLQGCSTVMNGTTTAVEIRSEPKGATARAPSGATCTTPCDLVVDSGTEFVTVSKDGRQERKTRLPYGTAWGWGVGGNTGTGALVGGLAATGTAVLPAWAGTSLALMGGDALTGAFRYPKSPGLIKLPKE